MKYCPYCGANLDDDMQFCPTCGKKYKGANNNQETEEVRENATDVLERKPSKNKRKWWLIILVLGIVCVAIVIALKSSLFTNHISETPTEPQKGKKEETIAFSEDTEKIAITEKSVVMINCYDNKNKQISSGSGVVLFDDKTVVTNYHVIDGVYNVHIVTDEDMIYNCNKILAYSKESDLAILEVEDSLEVEPLTLGDSNSIMKGEPVVAIGSPLGLKNTVSTGIISGRTSFGELEELQFTAAISNGSSGGALFNDKGEVIGITYASFIDGQNLNLAIPSENVKKLGERINEESTDTIANLCEKYHYGLIALWNSTKIPNTITRETLSNYEGKTVQIEGYIWDEEDNSVEYWLRPFSYEEYLANPEYDNLDSPDYQYLIDNSYKFIKRSYSSYSGTEGDEIGRGYYLIVGEVMNRVTKEFLGIKFMETIIGVQYIEKIN